MPLQSLGINKADLDTLHREMTGIVPSASREDFPVLLLKMLAEKSMRVIVTREEIRVEIGGVSCQIARPPRE